MNRFMLLPIFFLQEKANGVGLLAATVLNNPFGNLAVSKNQSACIRQLSLFIDLPNSISWPSHDLDQAEQVTNKGRQQISGGQKEKQLLL